MMVLETLIQMSKVEEKRLYGLNLSDRYYSQTMKKFYADEVKRH